ncbi:uncharacterized protein LOC141690938 [Apium graveolens]|uniref:uncharacterized protein LOC141690938 n=1 Tax=Apium graveolens TaxID=4045 RepID=UPI003D7B8EBC
MDKEGVKIPLRLHVHKETNQVIFAEANSDFVDTLFSFLTLPMGTIVRILKNKSDLQPREFGCFGNLYESFEKLDTKGCKTMLLNPRNAAEGRCRQLKLNIDDSGPTRYFICQNWACTKPELSINIPAKVCSCGETLSKPTNIKTNESIGTGKVFITETACFTVTDDLHVIPNVPTTVFKLLEKFGISDLTEIDEITLNIGYKEMLTLLKCSLQSNSPLTDVFVDRHFKSQKFKSMLVNPQVAQLHLSENHKFSFSETQDEYYRFAKTVKQTVGRQALKILKASFGSVIYEISQHDMKASREDKTGHLNGNLRKLSRTTSLKAADD